MIVSIGDVRFGNHLPLALIAGPCQLESREHALTMAAYLKEMTETEHDVDIKPLSKAAMKLDINPIPVHCLMILEANGMLAD